MSSSTSLIILALSTAFARRQNATSLHYDSWTIMITPSFFEWKKVTDGNTGFAWDTKLILPKIKAKRFNYFFLFPVVKGRTWERQLSLLNIYRTHILPWCRQKSRKKILSTLNCLINFDVLLQNINPMNINQ